MKILSPLLLLSLVACSTAGGVADPSNFSGMSPTSSHYPGFLTHIDADGYAFVWAPYAEGTEIAPEFVAVVRLPSDVHSHGASGATLSPRAWFGGEEPLVTLSCSLKDHNAYGPRRDDLQSDHYAPQLQAMTVNERSFEPRSGRLLLIDARGEPLRVIQVQCDPRRRAEIHGDIVTAGRKIYREFVGDVSEQG